MPRSSNADGTETALQPEGAEHPPGLPFRFELEGGPVVLGFVRGLRLAGGDADHFEPVDHRRYRGDIRSVLQRQPGSSDRNRCERT
jgi:hypothetical protein